MDPVSLPIPPSANHLWKTLRRRGKVRVFKSDGYEAWGQEAALKLRAGLPHYRTGRRYAVLAVVRPGKGWDDRRDLDNLMKPLVDAVKFSGRLPDDNTRYLVRVAVELGDPDPSGVASCDVYLTPVAPQGGSDGQRH